LHLYPQSYHVPGKSQPIQKMQRNVSSKVTVTNGLAYYIL